MSKPTEEKVIPKKEGIYHFICECGAGMANNKEAIDNAVFSINADKMYIHCPNKFYGKCNRSYSVKQFKAKALFIPPQNFNN